MKKVIEEMYSNYLNDSYNDIIPSFKFGSKRKEFEKLWDKLNKNFTAEEQNQNYTVLRDADYETGLFDFTNAFRLGFLFCTEIYLSNQAEANEAESKGEQL